MDVRRRGMDRRGSGSPDASPPRHPSTTLALRAGAADDGEHHTSPPPPSTPLPRGPRREDQDVRPTGRLAPHAAVRGRFDAADAGLRADALRAGRIGCAAFRAGVDFGVRGIIVVVLRRRLPVSLSFPRRWPRRTMPARHPTHPVSCFSSLTTTRRRGTTLLWYTRFQPFLLHHAPRAHASQAPHFSSAPNALGTANHNFGP
ncbi:hypothetical protein B0H17DRAFT_261976 [Mycena rosella]|uniref:Uncharacterized protein n=1 Tax=Mycena rosella TaxID=1033263 RepID=A0AAD7CWI7_MYCRO|nr:hypothetical protein B0H17DRAFT_261976 [Mycena rosella]